MVDVYIKTKIVMLMLKMGVMKEEEVGLGNIVQQDEGQHKNRTNTNK